MIYLKLLILVATFPKTLANLSIKLIPDPLIPASSPCRHLFLPVSQRLHFGGNVLAAFDAMTVHMATNRRELQKIIGKKETN